MLVALLLLITVLLSATPLAAWSPSPSHPGRGAPEAQEGWGDALGRRESLSVGPVLAKLVKDSLITGGQWTLRQGATDPWRNSVDTHISSRQIGARSWSQKTSANVSLYDRTLQLDWSTGGRLSAK